MSVCLEANNVLASQVSTSTTSSITEESSTLPQSTEQAVETPQPQVQISQPQPVAVKTIAKAPAASAASLSKASLITVLNAPLGNVKTLCVTPAVSSNASGQFTVVNSAPLNVGNTTVKPQTITLINTPVTVVKTISPSVEKPANELSNNSAAAAATAVPNPVENRGHNVFVKNTTSSSDNVAVATTDMPQSHKLLTANNFPTNNLLTTAINVSDISSQKTANGQQKGKVKILSNVLMSSASPNTGSIILNKTAPVHPLHTPVQGHVPPNRYIHKQKIMGPNNGAPAKYFTKPANNLINKPTVSMMNKQPQASQQRIMYPTHKSQIKTLPPVNNYMHGKPPGLKTLPPHPKIMPGQVQRSGTGLRTIPPQRPQKPPNKPNYIGKHAVQAQKLKPPHKLKAHKSPQFYAPNMPVQEKELTFNQALTAEILQTLGNKSGSSVGNNSYPMKSYEILSPRYDAMYYPPEVKPSFSADQAKPMEERNKSGLDALCQAVLLDHNYYSTLPPESPTRSVPPVNTSQMNGVPSSSLYSPGGGKRRTLSTSNPISTSTSLSTLSAVASNSNSMIGLQDDDAASDISDTSDRKHDTEGEETDTAPEAEAVNNEDQFGDYVTRCICGFLHDDGYMIECDRCKVWQHVQCVVKNKQVPEEYLCELCDPHKHVDRQKARMAQQQWLRDRQLIDPKLRKDPKTKELFKHAKDAGSDTDTSDGEHAGHNNNIVTKGRPSLMNRRKSDGHQKGPNAKQRRESVKETVQRRQVKKRERKVGKRKTKAQLKNHSDDENHDSTASNTHLPQLRQWIENYEEAVTNHYSPELRARMSNIRVNGAHTELTIHLEPSVHKCRVHTQPLTDLKYLVSTERLGPNSPVIELRGKYMLSAQHRTSGSSFNTRHSQRPGPFLFFYRLHKDNTEVCVDTRTYGNSARFVRRSCKPNAELRHSIVKGVLHLYIVTIADLEKNSELTIKHESHDLAAIGTTHIACACGNADECTVNRTTIKKNGDTTEIHKKRRGRRAASVSAAAAVESTETSTPKPKKEPPVQAETLVSPVPDPATPVKEEEIKTEPDDKENVDIKEEVVKVEVKQEIKEEEEMEVKEEIDNNIPMETQDIKEEVEEQVAEVKPAPPSPPVSTVTTRRSSSQHKNVAEKEESARDSEGAEGKSDKKPILHSPINVDKPRPAENKNKNKKLSREERKLEAILRAIAQMEKADQRKQEHQAKQAHRRESEPTPSKEEEKSEPKVKRKRRKGRARTQSTHTQNTRRNRLNSTDSYLTSGDETLLSPNENPQHRSRNNSDTGAEHMSTSDKEAGLLLALSGGGEKSMNMKSPQHDSLSNSAQSSPETHLSSACLLVQAAVEPMEQGFKFPKTKKGLMNEWLNKVPDPVHSASSISPSSLQPHINNAGPQDYDSNVNFYTPGKSLVALAQVASFCDVNVQPRGNAKKRWLRQAISEDQCVSPSGRPDSPPMNEPVAPPKKRRLPRESLSNDITPPTTPTSLNPPSTSDRPLVQEGCVEIVYSGADEDSPSQVLESDAVLEERAAEMKEEYSKCLQDNVAVAAAAPPSARADMTPMGCLMDPRLSRNHHIFSNSEHLVGTVEKTLSIFGFEDRKPDPITPAKRKVSLSISEYRQRKKLNNNDKSAPEDQTSTEENNSSESFKPSRPRSNSTSSCTSVTSSDDENVPLEVPGKAAPSAFNSEPTELERQREISSMRLKKAFGIPVDDESRKPALDVEAILNCELPTVVKTIPPSPNFPIPGSCDINAPAPKTSPTAEIAPAATVVSSPVVAAADSSPAEKTEVVEEVVTMEEMEVTETPDVEGKEVCGANKKSILFYTPDEEVHAQASLEEVDSVDYVPPFNNPIYPNDNNFTSYTSVIDEEGRYEGRNPSPPPEHGASSPFAGQPT